MRLITSSFPVSKVNWGWQVEGQNTAAKRATELKDTIDRVHLTEGHLLEIMSGNAFSNYSMTCKLQSTSEDSGIEWPALRNHIPCMAHVIQLALAAFISSLGTICRTRTWEVCQCDQQFGQNESIDIGNSQRLPKEGNATINKMSAMRPGFAKIIEKVCTSRYFESPETDLHVAENACGIDYANTWLSKQIHRQSKSQSPHRSTIN